MRLPHTAFNEFSGMGVSVRYNTEYIAQYPELFRPKHPSITIRPKRARTASNTM